MRISGRPLLVDGQLLLAVDRQQQVIAAEAEVFDAGRGQLLLGGPHDADVVSLGQAAFPVGRQRVDPLVDHLVLDRQRVVRSVPVAPDASRTRVAG